MTQLFVNNAYSSLASDAGAAATSMTLATGHGARFPSPSGGDFFLLTLVGLDSNGNENAWEIVKVTARATDTLTVVRAQESTTAAIWPAGARVEARSTAGTFASLTDAIEAAAAAPVQSVFGRTGAVTLLSNDVTTALGFTPENAANKGAANGYAPLGSDSKVPSTYLPSYVDDVLEYANLAALPGTGVTGVIYVTLDTNKVYRWSGSAYVEISASPGSTDAVTEGATNLYFTNARAQAALAGMYLPIGGGSLTGNLAFNGTNLRITGDFTSATRVMVQTNSANSPTYFGLLPNGTSVNAQFHVYGASDITNAPYGTLTINSASVRLQSTAAGSGTALPLTFLVGSTEVACASTSHNWLIGTASDDATHKLQVAGAIGVQVADAAMASRLRAATGMVRVRPYLDATSGVMIDSTNAAENAYLPLTLQGSAVRLLGSGGAGLTIDASGNLAYTGTLTGGTGVINIGSGQVYKDTAGNLGLGVTPSAWINSYKVLQLGTSTSLANWTGGQTFTSLNTNSYLDASAVARYIGTASAASYQQDNGAHKWFYAPSGTAGNAISFTQAMTLDANGNLEVFSGAAWTSGGIGPSGKQLTLGYDVTNSIGYLRSANNGTAYTPMYLDGSIIRFNVGTASLTEAARINSSGSLLVGTTSPNPVSDRVDGFATGPVGFLTLRATNNMALGLNATSGAHIYFYTDNGSAFVSAGSITSNGTATAYNTSSDYRLKENVQPMTGALARVVQMRPVTWQWKDGFGGTRETSEGFIAHELQAVCPQAVTGEKDAVDADGNPRYQGVDTSFLVATVVAALQELKTEFDAYKAAHP